MDLYNIKFRLSVLSEAEPNSASDDEVNQDQARTLFCRPNFTTDVEVGAQAVASPLTNVSVVNPSNHVVSNSVSISNQAKLSAINTPITKCYLKLLELLNFSGIDINCISIKSFIPTIMKQPRKLCFYKEASQYIRLMKMSPTNSLNIIEIFMQVKKLVLENHELKQKDKKILFDLINSEIAYEYQIRDLISNLLQRTATKDEHEFIKNIYKLFFEGDRLYNNHDNYQDNNCDNGALIFNNEPYYINKIISAFYSSLNQLIQDKKLVDILFLDKLASIFKSQKQNANSNRYYIVNLDKIIDNDRIIFLLRQGKISKKFITPSDEDIPEFINKDKEFNTIKYPRYIQYTDIDKHNIEEYINSMLDSSVKIELQETTEGDFYFVSAIKKLLDDGTEKVDTVTEPDTTKKWFKLEIYHSSKRVNKFSTRVIFDGNIDDRIKYVEVIINNFYEKIDQYEEKLKLVETQELLTAEQNQQAQEIKQEKLVAILEFLILLQRSHLYQDANGRKFMLLLVVLIYKYLGLFLTKQLYNLWKLIDTEEYSTLANKIIELCIEPPQLNFKAEKDWNMFNNIEDLEVKSIIADLYSWANPEFFN